MLGGLVQHPPMSLIDKLRPAADSLPPSHVPNSVELSGVVGALVAFAEHGSEFLKAAEKGVSDVEELLSPESKRDQQPQQAGQSSDKDAEIAALRQQLANAQAVQRQTRPSGAGGPPAAAPAPPGVEAGN